jgi:hypothetical protein
MQRWERITEHRSAVSVRRRRHSCKMLCRTGERHAQGGVRSQPRGAGTGARQASGCLRCGACQHGHQPAAQPLPDLDELADRLGWLRLVPVLRCILAGERWETLMAALDPVDTAIACETLSPIAATENSSSAATRSTQPASAGCSPESGNGTYGGKLWCRRSGRRHASRAGCRRGGRREHWYIRRAAAGRGEEQDRADSDDHAAAQRRDP